MTYINMYKLCFGKLVKSSSTKEHLVWTSLATGSRHDVSCLSVCPYVPFLWTRYLKKALRGFLTIWYKNSLGLMHEAIRIWLSKVKGQCCGDLTNPVLSCERNLVILRTSWKNLFKFGTNINNNKLIRFGWSEVEVMLVLLNTFLASCLEYVKSVFREFRHIVTCCHMDSKMNWIYSISAFKGPLTSLSGKESS